MKGRYNGFIQERNGVYRYGVVDAAQRSRFTVRKSEARPEMCVPRR